MGMGISDPLAFASDGRAFGFSEPVDSAADRRAALASDALFSATDRRAYFLLLRQKKVAKEKPTPRSAPGCARSLALLDAPGGWLNSPLRGSDNASRLPPDRLRCSAPLRGTPKTSGSQKLASDWLAPAKTAIGLPGPLEGAEQRRGVGGLRLALSEARRAEFSQPPDCPSSAGDPAQRGADLGVAFFLATFSWPSKKKYARASGAETGTQITKTARRATAENRGSATPNTRIKPKTHP